MNNLVDILTEKESEWLDFKREFHDNNAKLLHDILCLSNAHYDGDRFLVFGVSDDKTIYGIENDLNRKTNAELHDFLRQINLNRIPKIELTFHQIEAHEVGIIRIFNVPEKPYFVRKDFQVGKFYVRAGVIYTRLSDTNIPHNDTAPEDHIERMWKERIEVKNIKALSLEEKFPVKLNHSREHVHKVLGEPDAIGWQLEQYYSEGIEISYDQHHDFVEGLTITHLPSGTAFEGTLFGIKLGDTFSKAKEVLGPPDFWGLSYENTSMAVWEIADTYVLIWIWSNKKRDNSVPFQQLGTIRSISYCNKKSLIGYNVLAAKAMEQIKRGEKPKEFEREDIQHIDIEDPLFDEPFELLGGKPAIMGGAEVWVGFPESKEVIAFWIYPLEWRYPVIRAVYKLTKESPEEDLESA